MTYKVGPKGQVVIPKLVRDRLGIEPGDEVEVTLDEEGGSATVKPLARRGLWGIIAGAPGDALAALEREHREELEREDRRARSR